MMTEEYHMTSFKIPDALVKAIDHQLSKIEAATMAKVPRTEFFKESIWRYLDYLEKLPSEQEMIEILADRFDPWDGEARSITTFRETKVLIEAIDTLLADATAKNEAGREISRSSFFLKAFNWNLKELKNRRTEKAIAGILAEGKK